LGRRDNRLALVARARGVIVSTVAAGAAGVSGAARFMISLRSLRLRKNLLPIIQSILSEKAVTAASVTIFLSSPNLGLLRQTRYG